MFTFHSPIIRENNWKICFKTSEELFKDFYSNNNEEVKEKINGYTEYSTLTIYLDKDLKKDKMIETLRKQLLNLYLWETGQQDRYFNEEELCDLASVSIPIIYENAEKIIDKLKKENKI